MTPTRTALGLLLLCLIASLRASACDSGPACVCPKTSEPDGPPQPWSWVEESVVGGSSPSATPRYHAAADRNWKVFPDKFPDLVKAVGEGKGRPARLYYYLGMLGVSALLFVAVAYLVHRGNAGREIRRVSQILFLVLWVFVFAQCLCSVKDVAVLLAYAGRGQFFYGLCTAWLALLAILFTLLLRRRFKTFFCFWACPVGTLQDLLETGIHQRLNDRLKIALLVLSAAALVAILAWNIPRPLNLIGGPVLALFMIVFAILSILRPGLEPRLRRFVFVSMAGWFVLNLVVMLYDIENKTPGPWCVPGVANLKHPLVLTFVILLAVSMIVPRAWCKFVCPNRGLFELLSGRREHDDLIKK